MTECIETKWNEKLEFRRVGRRRVEADFSAGQVSSDGGSVLLGEADRVLGLSERMAGCFTDHRHPLLIEHTLEELVRQRVFGLALGYEDLNDHDILSRDPLLATVVGKSDPEGRCRGQKKALGMGMASASTLGRVERTKADATPASRYEKVVCDFDALRDAFVSTFIASQPQTPVRLVLDVDPTDIELHGNQEQRFYHGYYGHHCYLPMYVYCGEYPLAVTLRPSNIDGSLGIVELLEPIVTKLRESWPNVHVILRADSGFCREEFLSWLEANQVDYVIGLARNRRVVACIDTQMEQARRDHLQTGKPARRFRNFRYRTLKTWTRSRRVIGKAEYMDKGANPRFVVTSLSAKEYEKRYLYEELYCARGEMENRLKEQLELFADRASCHTFRGNEVRLWWAMAAQLLVVTIRRLGLAGTELERAQAPTLRTKLFKIGALITVSVRRVYIRWSSAFPRKSLFLRAIEALRARPAPT